MSDTGSGGGGGMGGRGGGRGGTPSPWAAAATSTSISTAKWDGLQEGPSVGLVEPRSTPDFPYRVHPCYIYCTAIEMKRHDALGEFEHAVLAAVAHLDADAYGVTIRREIESRTRRHVSIGGLYTALDRLERKGYVTSTMSDPTPRRGGRSKRHVRITSIGSGALRQSREFLERMWAGLALEPRRSRT